MNILYKYLNESVRTPDFLDKVALEFKKELIKNINQDIIQENIDDKKTIEKLNTLLNKFVKNEFNVLEVPYFEILENINLCVEVEMSEKAVNKQNSQRFGEVKFSQIMVNGIEQSMPVKRFAISEKLFLESLVSFIEKYTNEYNISDDRIKIEFN